MDESRRQAYRVILAQGLLHLKWDLAAYHQGLSLSRPWRLSRESRRIRRASSWAYTFHNLAIFSTQDFQGFSEESFWEGIEKFSQEFPDALCPYREVFDRCLRGERIAISAPNG
jgi:hypothetical protein